MDAPVRRVRRVRRGGPRRTGHRASLLAMGGARPAGRPRPCGAARLSPRRRKHAAIEESQRLTRKYATLVIQNEQIRTWNKNKGYARGGRKIHAGILGRLYANLKQQQNVIIPDKWQPTTSWCRNCGRRTPCPVNLRTYTCAYCGVREDRDQHAALNMTVLRLAPLSHTDLRKARDIPHRPLSR